MANLMSRKEVTPRITRAGSEWHPAEMFRDMLGWDPFQLARRGGTEAFFAPAFEVKESADAYFFKADLPGVKEDDLDISLSGNRLTIGGKRESEEVQEGDTYYARECSYGLFTRAFTLPDTADGEHVTASLESGVLTLSVPKKPETQPKKISVKHGGKERQAKA